MTCHMILPLIISCSIIGPVSNLSGGAIAAIVIMTLLAVAVVVVLVIAVIFYMRWKVKNVDLPPPSRKGSMRLVSRMRDFK